MAELNAIAMITNPIDFDVPSLTGLQLQVWQTHQSMTPAMHFCHGFIKIIGSLPDAKHSSTLCRLPRNFVKS